MTNTDVPTMNVRLNYDAAQIRYEGTWCITIKLRFGDDNLRCFDDYSRQCYDLTTI